MDEQQLTTSTMTEEEERLLEEALVSAHEDQLEQKQLPVNSKSLLIHETTSRFSSAEWYNEIISQKVLLAGLGGIGSYVAFLLGRLNIGRLIIYDDDKVDETNISGQLFSMNDIGSSKVDSICKKLRTFSNYYNTVGYNRKFEFMDTASDIMICGFDNMKARKEFFAAWSKHVLSLSSDRRNNCLFIDGRLAAEEFQVFCIKGTDTYLMQKYEKEHLFDDSVADETPCSYKQTSFCANMIASVMVNLFVNFIANKCEPVVDRTLPFYTWYDAELMYLRTKMV